MFWTYFIMQDYYSSKSKEWRRNRQNKTWKAYDLPFVFKAFSPPRTVILSPRSPPFISQAVYFLSLFVLSVLFVCSYVFLCVCSLFFISRPDHRLKSRSAGASEFLMVFRFSVAVLSRCAPPRCRIYKNPSLPCSRNFGGNNFLPRQNTKPA